MTLNKTELENKIKPAKPLLEHYVQLLLKWQKSVNLISENTIKDIWDRHILDSAQLYFLLDSNQQFLMDVGSGGGLPAVVIAILNQELKGPLNRIVLVESDLKKSLFLEECKRNLSLNIEIIRDRIENISLKPDVITARALAPLKDLFRLIQKNVSRETFLLFPKGKNVDKEIENVTNPFDCEKITNVINNEGCILKIKGVHYE
ncbi:MAG: 16S rRNA (guanine(527)-N(7))-methyltransferase RsmG [Alphaproteobacteria bacterium]|nr:16S rRNA (guanine(527)-N(7))-methyltransferase RsmG [Alphaproteobacteria bacterium]MBQ4471708.1 16S rRNA (guanine(527)-N(7))-methyltransferase RsmG [Alphaproteobacteria bacterium]